MAAALRAVTSFHEHPAVIAWWAARLGRLGGWLDAGRRRQLLSLGALVVLLVDVMRKHYPAGQGATPGPGVRALVLAPILLAIFGLCLLAAARFGRLPRIIGWRPQVVLHLGFWALLAVVWVSPAWAPWRAGLVLLVVLAPDILWRLGYLLKSGQRGKAAGAGPTAHLFYVWPVWGGSETPYGKGLDYLARREAGSAETLAQSQLAGIKLLLLAVLWRAAVTSMDAVVYGETVASMAVPPAWSLDLPRLRHLVADPGSTPLWVAWFSVYAELVRSTLTLAVNGHTIVGVLRLCGFNVFRNTYKPLLADSVVEFWNRYYYYFKELLAEFFFFPTYTRFRVRPWLRTLLAVFAAAFLGNLYYHLLQRDQALLSGDVVALWDDLHSRAFYCFLLATGIWVSMQRERRRRGALEAGDTGAVRRLVRVAGVWTFYGLIHIWAIGRGHPTFDQRTRFFLALFGWS